MGRRAGRAWAQLAQRGLGFDALGAGLMLAALGFCACLVPAQADTFWHLRAGRDFWTTGHIPLSETFSYTAAGRPWPNHEWLWQVLTFGVYRAGGLPLLTLACGAVLIATIAATWRLLSGPTRRRALLMAAGMPLGAVVWAERPQIASLLFLVVTLLLLRARRLWLLPPLFVLWANLHGAVALGVLALAVAALVEVASLGPRAWKLPLTSLLALAATLATPLGLGLWSFIVESIGRSSEVHINEWRPLSFAEIEGVWFAALAAPLLVMAWRRRRTLVQPFDRALVLLAIILAPLAARHGRNVAPFVLVAVPALSRLWPPTAATATPSTDDHPRFNLALLVLGVAGAAAALAWAYARPLDRLGWRPLSPGAITAVRACPGHLYNRYDDGGYLTFFVPERPVFIDSRQDPYPRDFVAAHVRDEARGAFSDTFARWNVACAFLPPSSPTVVGLRAAGWSTRFADPRWVVLERPR